MFDADCLIAWFRIHHIPNSTQRLELTVVIVLLLYHVKKVGMSSKNKISSYSCVLYLCWIPLHRDISEHSLDTVIYAVTLSLAFTHHKDFQAYQYILRIALTRRLVIINIVLLEIPKFESSLHRLYDICPIVVMRVCIVWICAQTKTSFQKKFSRIMSVCVRIENRISLMSVIIKGLIILIALL